MAEYYIDFENVLSNGLIGVENLTADDNVHLLYSKHAENVKMEQVQELMSTGASVSFTKVATGTPNALDFQLVAMLFYKLDPETETYIISNDHGFDVAIKMGRAMGLRNIKRRPRIDPDCRLSEADWKDEEAVAELIGEESQPAHKAKKENKKEITEDVKTVEPKKKLTAENIQKCVRQQCNVELTKKQADNVAEAVKQCSCKQAFYTYLRKNLGEKEGLRFYREIRDAFDALRKLA